MIETPDDQPPIGYFVFYPYTEFTYTVKAVTAPSPKQLERLKDQDVIFVWLH